jgi:putative oxidoreductase
MAKNGLEPSSAFAAAAMFLETVGALCVLVGLFTRFFAAALAIELLIAFLLVYLKGGLAVAAPNMYCARHRDVFHRDPQRRAYSVDRLIGKEL